MADWLVDCVVEDRLADDWLGVSEAPAAADALAVLAVLVVLPVLGGLVVLAALAVLALVTARVTAVMRAVWLRVRACWSR